MMLNVKSRDFMSSWAFSKGNWVEYLFQRCGMQIYRLFLSVWNLSLLLCEISNLPLKINTQPIRSRVLLYFLASSLSHFSHFFSSPFALAATSHLPQCCCHWSSSPPSSLRPTLSTPITMTAVASANEMRLSPHCCKQWHQPFHPGGHWEVPKCCCWSCSQPRIWTRLWQIRNRWGRSRTPRTTPLTSSLTSD